MIKIDLERQNDIRRGYLSKIGKEVANCVRNFQYSLYYLSKKPLKTSYDFKMFNEFTLRIIDEAKDKINTKNNEIDYLNEIDNYISSSNNLQKINLNGLVELCKFLLKKDAKKLSNLLSCNASYLLKFNNLLLSKFNLEGPHEKEILKSVFNYNELKKDIRKFFDDNELTNTCPYCNIEIAEKLFNEENEFYTNYDLDHFYNQAKYPLLSLSLTNLVPADIICNRSIKFITEFDEINYLNPYEDGYSNSIKFALTKLDDIKKFDGVSIEILEPTNTLKYVQINGENSPSKEKGKLGMLNILKIRSRYTEKIALFNNIYHLIDCFYKVDKENYFINNEFSDDEKRKAYLKWFKDRIQTEFNPVSFNKARFSKVNRDLHDLYYEKYSNPEHHFVKDLIEEYSSTIH